MELREVSHNGYTFRIDDTVYLQPESDGGVDEAYFMGRILKFAVDDKGHHTCLVGWFYRTRDISMRRRGDSRMLVATMHSDWNPIESIRGKCTIRHRQHIDDLEAYKMQDDCFYYEQLYDRFTQRFYDVVPMESVRTLPPDTMESLKAFDFIVTDAGKGTDFTSMEVCTTCSAGAVPTDSVQCVDCARVYHMRCLDPPLLRKPGKGFAWTCVQCLQKKQILYSNNGTASSGEVADQIPRPAKEKPSFSRGQKKATPATRAPIDKNRRRPLWPFRYVGDYARFREVLSDADDDTIIYPRAASRIGKKYQADLPEFGAGEPVTAPVLEEVTMPQAPLVEEGAEAAPGEAPDAEDDAPASGRVSPPNAAQGGEYRARGRIPLWRKRLIMQQEAKESPIEGSDIRQDLSEELAFSLPEDAREEDFDRFFDECLQNLPGPNRVDFLDRSLLELHRTGYDLEEAAVAAKSLTPGDVDLAEWTPEEVQLFEDGVARLGHDLFGISKELSSKRRRDIVQFFYLWKKTPRYIPVYSMYCRKHRPNKRFKKTTEEAEPADVVMKDADDQAAQTEQYCTNCWTTTPPILLASIRGQDKTTICKRCLEYWLRYAVNRHVSDGTKRSNRDDSGRDAPQGGSGQGKRGGRKANKGSKSEEQKNRVPCGICSTLQSYSNSPMFTCAQCALRVHEECYGAEPPDEDSPWFCARCKFSRENTDTVPSACVLCRNPTDKTPEAYKRTIGGSWVHVLCSLWIPEVKFADVANLELVDIATVDRKKWAAPCGLCSQDRGACLTCSYKSCSKTFHVSCAKRGGLALQVEEGKAGKLNATLYCQEHKSFASESHTPKSELVSMFVEQYKGLPRQFSDYRGAALRSRTMGIMDRCECHFGQAAVVPSAPAGGPKKGAGRGGPGKHAHAPQVEKPVEPAKPVGCSTIQALREAFDIEMQ